LKDPAKLAKHIEDRVVQRTQQLTAKASTEREQKTRTEQAQAQLTREFQDAATAHTDFVTHKPAVHQLLQKAPSLSVEEAYRLATHEALVKRVNEGETAKRELATAKAELERLKKNATQLPAGAGAGSATGEDKFMSPAERSYARATTKRTARGAPA
jgi:CYTH domain-containing protein